MIPSQQIVDFVKRWESCRLRAYQDGAGVWTIGYGHTRDVHPGDTCTQEQADEWVVDELVEYGEGLSRYITRAPRQNQFDGLLSLAYNCGIDAIGMSGVMARHNAGLFDECGERFLMWNRSGGVVVRGLTKRRAAERDVYASGDYSGSP